MENNRFYFIFKKRLFEMKNITEFSKVLLEKDTFSHVFIPTKFEVTYISDIDEDNEVLCISRNIDKKTRYEILKRQKWACNICGERLRYGRKISFSPDAQVAHIDHIHPFSKRNSYPNGIQNINETSNLQALCPQCNLSKSEKEIN